MTADQEDKAVERPHWQAHQETGFYGRQGAGCIIVAQRTGRVLLSHRSGSVEEPHTWGNWGGAVDEGVDPQEHAEREVYQECGYQGKVLAIVPLYQFQKGSFRYSNFMIVVPDEFTPDLNWESQGFRWCRYGEWPTPLHFGLVALFNDGQSASLIKRVCSAALDPSVHESLDEEEEEHDHERHFQETDDHIEPAILDEEADFEQELAQTGGSYNLPWEIGGKRGTATARYTMRNGEFQVTLLSVRDETGKEMKPNDKLGDAIQKAAIKFIGNE
jgi:8-oxo-dGTP pyrophosphatase MutT (NUDIX family)